MSIESDLQELEQLRAIKTYIQGRIDVLEEVVKKKARKERRRANSLPKQGSKILTAQVTPFVREWVDSGRTLEALAEEAAVSIGTIYNIINNTTVYTNEYLVDSIMTAMGHQHTALLDVPEPPPSHYWEE